MRIGIGCDHRGLNLKRAIADYLKGQGHTVTDLGCHNNSPVDYPDIAVKVAQGVAKGDFDRGILVCNTGIGMGVVANKLPGIRAAVCHDLMTARFARLHNDANILCLGEGVLGPALALEMAEAFLNTPFEGGRHLRRLAKVSALEQGTRQPS